MSKNPVAVFTMKDGGQMRIELFPDKAPITVDSFIDLVQCGFYNGLTFHRVISGFVIQAGSRSGSCAGENLGFTIKGEFRGNGSSNDLTHPRGTISMARTNVPDSASSQFFICHQEASNLDGQYAAFGLMTDGFETLDAIASTKTRSAMEENRPIEPQIIEKLEIELNDYQPKEPVRIGEMKAEFRK